MPVDRPTFSESWYRVADLRPRLLSTVQIHRQHFRGQVWHVVADPASNQFFRLNEAAYQFVAMLDGRRTVSEVWKVCNDRLGDDAPTQPEAIQLLGQLYTSNLLAAELPPDAEGLFNRYHKRITREIQGYLMNIMFVRIPLLDPDHFLDRWIGVFGWIFSWFGALLWLALMSVGMYFLIGDWDRLFKQANDVFQQMTLMQNLPMMYVATVVTKVLHEFGHAFACKKFGRQTGSGGEVHAMGVMFLIFTPLPYVDASSSWAFRSKWHRIVVGLAGMYIELALAAVAAIVWARTSDPTWSSLSFYVIFIAGVSTVLFNANPLLRYDGYYILSDALEMPNLWQRSRQYVYYLVKRYAWGVRRPFNPANGVGERLWLTAYGIASTIYRVVVCAAILFFISDRLFLLGAVLAVAAVVAWVFVPAGQFLHYLFTNGELMRVRGRAMFTTLLVLIAAVIGIGLISVPDYTRAEGQVDSENMKVIHAGIGGFIEADLGPDTYAKVAKGQTLVECVNPELAAQAQRLEAQLEGLEATRQAAVDESLSGAPVRQYSPYAVYDVQIQETKRTLADVQRQLADLRPVAPFAGDWVRQADTRVGDYVQPGQELGKLADPSRLIIRAFAAQNDAWLIEQADKTVEICPKGRPDLKFTGKITEILPAGQSELPSSALGFAAGGDIPVLPSDKEGRQASEHIFEIRIAPSPQSNVKLRCDQRVVVRFRATAKPLAEQWWRAVLQMIQKRFSVEHH